MIHFLESNIFHSKTILHVFALVINKKHGAPTTIKHLKELFNDVEVIDKSAGFNVIRCKK